jgi:predicted small metal-binding protein
MASQVTCECGFLARAGSDDEVVAQVREHIGKDHPELIDTVTPDVIRGWIQVVD